MLVCIETILKSMLKCNWESESEGLDGNSSDLQLGKQWGRRERTDELWEMITCGRDLLWFEVREFIEGVDCAVMISLYSHNT